MAGSEWSVHSISWAFGDAAQEIYSWITLYRLLRQSALLGCLWASKNKEKRCVAPRSQHGSVDLREGAQFWDFSFRTWKKWNLHPSLGIAAHTPGKRGEWLLAAGVVLLDWEKVRSPETAPEKIKERSGGCTHLWGTSVCLPRERVVTFHQTAWFGGIKRRCTVLRCLFQEGGREGKKKIHNQELGS